MRDDLVYMNEILYQWLAIKCEGKNLSDNILNVQRIAIYGMGELGRLLFMELGHGRDILCIDREVEGKVGGIEIRTPDILEHTKVDVIILTVIKNNIELKKQIEDKYGIKTMRLEDLLFNV